MEGITIGGITIPLKDIAKLGSTIPTIAFGISSGLSASEILSAIAPEVLPVVEEIANIVFPGSGTAISIVAYLIEHSKTMTQEETNAWMARFGAGNQ